MRNAERSAIATVVVAGLAIPTLAYAQSFNVPPGRIGDVATAIGEQAGATVAVPEPDVAAHPSPGVHGTMSLRAALTRALRGTGASAVFYDPITVRIVRKKDPVPTPAKPKPISPPATIAPPPEIVVTASKQNMTLGRYPGSVKLLSLDPGWVARNAADGTSAITRLLPTLGSTNLGAGRNKVFIRGIADSSFNGPTQAATGQYLGDVRLNYNAPDPDLNLYDMKQVEVLVGPQGTLYGAGSLGGIIRLVPHVPDMHNASGTASAAISATQSGGISRNGAGMLNIPLVDDRLAARFVVYGGHDAGYIDDPSRGLKDINHSKRYGGRFSMRARLSDWTVDIGFIFQNIATADGQYTLSSDAPLTRGSTIAQPFGNDYRLGYITARGPVGDAELVSTTSIARQNLTTVFDATGYDGTSTPERFEEDNGITTFSHETRIAGGPQRAPWVAGVSALFNSSALSRALGPLEAQEQITGVVNIQAEGALFGQFSHPLTRTLTGTIGGRLTFANSTGFLIDETTDGSKRSSRSGVRFSSTLALDWHPGGPWSAFFHYQQGYRAGGLAIAPSGSGLVSQRFATDSLNMNELGIRLGDEARDPLSVRAAIFFADWAHIQADLVDSSGLPYTADIGSGRIYGIDGQVTWKLSPTLTLSAAAFINGSRLTNPQPQFETSSPQSLPNIARAGGRIAAAWHGDIAPGVHMTGDTSLRYVGKSTLGVGSLLDIAQGNYLVIDAGARVDLGRFGVSLDLDNAANARANTFAFGNPFSIAQRDQVTPLRPRTIRLGLDMRF